MEEWLFEETKKNVMSVEKLKINSKVTCSEKSNQRGNSSKNGFLFWVKSFTTISADEIINIKTCMC